MALIYRFNDKALTDVARKSAVKFSNFQKHLDQTSSDIKALEKWLQTCAICIPVHVDVEGECMSICWDNIDAGWRLLCRQSSRDFDGEEVVDLRPLIETPARVRLLSRPYLPTLISELADLLPTEAPSDDTSDDGFDPLHPLSPPAKEPAKAGSRYSRRPQSNEDNSAFFAESDEIPF